MIDNEKVIYPELSYRIVGIAYEVYNELGYGMQEKHYQRAFEVSLKEKDVLFESQKCVELSYKNESIGRYFLDLIVDDKIILELKVRPRMGYVHIKQVLEYLRVLNCQLAILIYFTREGVKYRRILNKKV